MIVSETEVVIVGGGAAGIAAARRLTDAGVDCLIVEARDRLGGRAWTADVGGYPVDLGCGWLHSADRNPWCGIARAQGRDIDRTPPPWTRPAISVGFSPDEQAAFRAAMNDFYERVDELADAEPDRAATACLDPNNRWNGLIGAVGTYVTGADLDRVSVRDLARYEDSGVNYRVAAGYGTVIAAHATGVRVALNCPVRRIDHSGRRVSVETSEGTISAASVIVTLPSTVLAEQRVLFTPDLPDKTDAALGLPLGLADKLFLSLDGAEEFDADSRLFGHTDRRQTATYHMRPFGRPLIEVYFGGSFAHELEAGGEAAFVEFALSELTGLLGSDFARRVKPAGLQAWGTDPFARGSYSSALPGKAESRAVLAAPVDGRLFFAGEACSRHDFSTAHGAYLTGIAAAEQVMKARKI
jgi:monoamine oxidase